MKNNKNKLKKGDIIMSIPEIYDIPVGISISIKEDGIESINSDDLEAHCLMPLDAREFEDPKNPKNILRCNLKDRKQDTLSIIDKTTGLEVAKAIKMQDVPETIKVWNETVAYIKCMYPNMKLHEAIEMLIL